jgi:mRNA-decapping enzyme subunit 2
MTSTNQAYLDALDDVHTRFILNLPPSELATPTRIFFQLEQAWWFYDDFICDNSDVDLPRYKHMKPFSLAMFEYSFLLKPLIGRFDEMYAEFSGYKRSISTYGTILLNEDATKIALCRNWNGKSWTLPGGKVNQNETGRDAAARETYEETGFDPYCERGICAKWRERRERGEDVPEMTVVVEDEDDVGLVPYFESEAPTSSASSPLMPWSTLLDVNKLSITENDTNKRRTCYVCRGVPESFPFEPVARKEVSEVKFYDINDLPNKTYAVLPFMGHLKKWIRNDNKRRNRGNDNRSESRPGSRPKSRNKNQEERRATPNRKERGESTPKQLPTPKKEKRPNSRPKSKPRSNSREVDHDDPLVTSALATPGESNRWTEEEMFAANERILGRKITYDGNPHQFAEKGFGIENGQRLDPHAFHVVGGHFMNSNNNMALAPPPRMEAMQPIMAKNRSSSGEFPDDEVEEFTPFFSNAGKAPWEEEGARLGGLMEGLGIEVKKEEEEPVKSIGSNSKGLALLSRLRQGVSATDLTALDESNPPTTSQDNYDWFLTDKEVTAKSQKEKLCSMLDMASPSLEAQPTQQPAATHLSDTQNEHWLWMKNWVSNLPKAPATKYFGEFRFDVDSIMESMSKRTPVNAVK